MSDEKAPLWPPRFDRVAKHQGCPICETNSWWAFDPEEEIGSLTVRTPSVEFYARSCVTCGYVQYFIKAVLDGDIQAPGGNND